METIQRRYQRAAERILEDERITAGLDDESARALISWGLNWVGRIVGDAEGLPEYKAKELLSSRLKANRRMLRYVNKWLKEPPTALPERPMFPGHFLWSNPESQGQETTRSNWLGKVYKQAQIASGYDALASEAAYDIPEASQALPAYVAALGQQPAEEITRLRAHFEQSFFAINKNQRS